jgi:hypothetical protein
MATSVDISGRFTFFSCSPGLSPYFLDRNAFTAEFVACREETLTRVTLGKEGLVFFAELVPEIVEVVVVRAEYDV